MRDFPGCRFFEPADLGFSAQAIGAGAAVNGPVFPVAAGLYLTGAVLYFLDTGPSTNIDVHFSPVDLDTTVLGAVNVPIVTTLNPAINEHVLVRIHGAAVVASSGTADPKGAALLNVPYARLVVTNNDGANAAAVTLRLSLCGALQ